MTVTKDAPVSCCGHVTQPNSKDIDMTFKGLILPTTKRFPEIMSLEEIEVAAPCLHEDMDSAVDACINAQHAYFDLPMTQRKAIIQNIRDKALLFAEDFALSAISETGRGRYDDKVTKQRLAANSTPGTEDIKPVAYTGDHGLTTIDLAPFGVIGAVTPVTNPTATVINNSITILAGGNGVVFNPHPAAMRCTNRAIAVVNEAIREKGGPCCLVASVKIPTIPSGNRLMTHPKTAANLITGGPAVVKLALSSGKKSFCAGPGNPPVVVDETADMEVAALGIYDGASFDNNMICSDEKEVFVVREVADKLLAALRNLGAYILTEAEIKSLTPVCIPQGCENWQHGIVDKDLVGQSAATLLARIGKTCPENTKLLIAPVDASHPLVWTEQLMPILPVVAVDNFDVALDYAIKAEHGFKHTCSIYSSSLKHISTMGKKMNTSLYIVNGSHTAGLASGGEGYTSFSIAGSTGEGLTRPSTFVRERRMTCVNQLRFV